MQFFGQPDVVAIKKCQEVSAGMGDALVTIVSAAAFREIRDELDA